MQEIFDTPSHQSDRFRRMLSQRVSLLALPVEVELSWAQLSVVYTLCHPENTNSIVLFERYCNK